MANNKIQLADGTVLVDLTDTTAVASDVAQGKYFYGADGTKTVGTATGGTGAISVVDTTDSHGGTVRTITAIDISDTTAIASDVAQGKYFYTADGTKTAGTASGGSTPSATQHSIYFEFSDDTNTTITAYYDSTFISDAITATTPTTYGGKTVDSASLDNIVWYTRPTETWETLFDRMLSWTREGSGDYPYCWISDLGSTPITVGSVYRVTYNNVEYRCTGKNTLLNGSSYTVFGNPAWGGGADDGSGVPFIFIDYTKYGAWSGGLNVPNVDSTYYFKIERLVS